MYGTPRMVLCKLGFVLDQYIYNAEFIERSREASHIEFQKILSNDMGRDSGSLGKIQTEKRDFCMQYLFFTFWCLEMSVQQHSVIDT
jgi:hypothetical protein